MERLNRTNDTVADSATLLRWNEPQGAVFDATQTYRYTLWRCWNPEAPSIAFIMLNPSTADAAKDDPTIRSCRQFAKVWDYGSVEIVNLFAYRATLPRDLRCSLQPIGDDNDRYILEAVESAAKVVVAWGNWRSWLGRDRTLLNLLSSTPLHCLGVNQSAQPRHPLYVKRDTRLQQFIRKE
ncbi:MULTISPECIES: DUF1643 domain-containing protein [unclassified Leptolyngbya]|uniref:DUF1643 domain-containing protein n=1 Tax=unclassified Leptolyngbya TaxID=2650499 RepID=UPI0016884762|nr:MULTISPECIES: DUF1643 domain-containing protein [unclassified Leptolyngbya]MBD1910234.1 DUF1643 domain-containing protein [Leptolyngbya sp. FACHB-8]MBD2155905.1 DUF1643 domain-containing protein [Leptolyngbya sp. FACHB-16]